MTVKVFKKCCTSKAMDGICYRMAVKNMGMLGVSVRKMKVLTVKMETDILIGKGRQNPTCFVYKVYEINCKIFFLFRHIISGGSS